MVIGDEAHKPRLWLVFFGDASPYWWRRFLTPGFRHVSAASFYADQERWVYVDPTAHGLVIEIARSEDFGRRLGQLIRDSAAIIRVPARASRTGMPLLSFWCVGVVKSLLGTRSCALSPRQLWAHLLANGAEIVEIPDGEAAQLPEAAPGRPEGESLAGPGGSTCGAGSYAGDARPALP